MSLSARSISRRVRRDTSDIYETDAAPAPQAIFYRGTRPMLLRARERRDGPLGRPPGTSIKRGARARLRLAPTVH